MQVLGQTQIPESDGRSEYHAKPFQNHALGRFLVSGKGDHYQGGLVGRYLCGTYGFSSGVPIGSVFFSGVLSGVLSGVPSGLLPC